jgi:hypothetical protein
MSIERISFRKVTDFSEVYFRIKHIASALGSHAHHAGMLWHEMCRENSSVISSSCVLQRGYIREIMCKP